LSVLFPDLTLAEFHGRIVLGSNLSLLIFVSGETATSGHLPFLVGGLFGGHGLLFLLVGAAGPGLFL
jgi:hypothetical protein